MELNLETFKVNSSLPRQAEIQNWSWNSWKVKDSKITSRISDRGILEDLCRRSRILLTRWIWILDFLISISVQSSLIRSSFTLLFLFQFLIPFQSNHHISDSLVLHWLRHPIQSLCAKGMHWPRDYFQLSTTSFFPQTLCVGLLLFLLQLLLLLRILPSLMLSDHPQIRRTSMLFTLSSTIQKQEKHQNGMWPWRTLSRMRGTKRELRLLEGTKGCGPLQFGGSWGDRMVRAWEGSRWVTRFVL